MSQNQVSSCRVQIACKLYVFVTVESITAKIRITEDAMLIIVVVMDGSNRLHPECNPLLLIVQHNIQLFAY